VSFPFNVISPRFFWLIFIAVGLLVVCLLWKYDPVTAGFFPPCIFYKATDLYCPGCGATRACDALIEGNFGKAFGYNPLFVVCFPFVILFLICSIWFGIVKNEEFKVHARFSKYLLILAFVTLAYGVIRNLPFEAFSWMRP
jgi:hypothetical protein